MTFKNKGMMKTMMEMTKMAVMIQGYSLSKFLASTKCEQLVSEAQLFNWPAS